MRAQLATAHLAARSDTIRAAQAQVEAARAALAQAEWELAQKTRDGAGLGRCVHPPDGTTVRSPPVSPRPAFPSRIIKALLRDVESATGG